MSKVMIVDDSLYMRNHLAKVLGEHGYDTLLAENGVEAVSTYRAARPDVVLMDITMPQMNGLDALAEIRQFDLRAKVIILTALDQQLVAARAVHMGAKDFLVKPVPASRLLITIQKVLRSSA